MEMPSNAWRLLWLAPIATLVMAGAAVADEVRDVNDGESGLTHVAGELPELTQGEVDDADAIALEDERLSLLLSKAKSRVQDEGIWHNRRLDLLGVSRIIRFENPISLGRGHISRFRLGC